MNAKNAVLPRAVAAAALLFGLMAAPALAKIKVTDQDGGINISGKSELHLDADKMRHDDVTVAKGETLKGDVVTSGSIVVEGTVEGNAVSFGGNVAVPGEVRGDVVTLGGNVDLGGSSKGDLAAIGGSVAVSGKVGGDVAAIGGNVALSRGASVGGDVSVLGGHLAKEDGVSIKGSVSQVGLGALKGLLPALTRGGLNLALASNGGSNFHSHWRHDDWKHDEADSAPSAGGRLLKAGVFLIFVVGLGLVLCLAAVFLPAETAAVAAAVRQDFWRSAGVGTLMVILFLPGLLVLTVSILGIPLIPLAVLAWCAAALFGVAAFSRVLAERASESMQKPLPAAPLAVGMGWLMLETLPLVGKLIGGFIGGTLAFAGFLLLMCGMVAGLGAVWNTRMGRRAL
jgi:cytoskeletal protein CcmA (bactofilin family)